MENLKFDIQKAFETDDYLYFYSNILTKKRTKKEVDFLVRELDLDKSLKILDVACGFGRHSNALAKAGFNITGVDISKGFLEIAANNAKKNRLNVNYICKDMRKIDFKNEFERVYMLFTSFGYFNDGDNFKVLKNAAAAMKLGGLFCLEILNKDSFIDTILPFYVVEKGKDLMIDRNIFDGQTSRSLNRRIIIRDGVRKDKPFFIRLYNLAEIKDLLKKAGFAVYRVFSSYDSAPANNKSVRLLIIARKKER